MIALAFPTPRERTIAIEPMGVQRKSLAKCSTVSVFSLPAWIVPLSPHTERGALVSSCNNVAIYRCLQILLCLMKRLKIASVPRFQALGADFMQLSGDKTEDFGLSNGFLAFPPIFLPSFLLPGPFSGELAALGSSYPTMAPSHILIIYMFTVLGINAACYFPNRTEHDGGDKFPCDSTNGVESMCCNLRNTTKAGSCRSDGLCMPSDNSQLWRGPCTDRTWKDLACLPLCIEGEGEILQKIDFQLVLILTYVSVTDYRGLQLADHDWPITICADGSLCCGYPRTKDSLACCASRQGYAIEQGRVIKARDAKSSTSTAAEGQSSTPTAKSPSSSSGSTNGVSSTSTATER